MGKWNGEKIDVEWKDNDNMLGKIKNFMGRLKW